MSDVEGISEDRVLQEHAPNNRAIAMPPQGAIPPLLLTRRSKVNQRYDTRPCHGFPHRNKCPSRNQVC